MASLPRPEQVARSILWIFVERFNLRPGEVLVFNSILAVWDETGFRAADRKSGFDYAVERGWVEFAENGRFCRLTEAGFSAAGEEADGSKEPNADGVAQGHFTDRELMQRAIELARGCKSEPGRVSPKVGAVAARKGILLGEAFRGEFKPGEHAEYTLLERKLSEETLAGATLYVTLEPCTKRSEPKIACANRIAERRIRQVYIGMLDPNPEILGTGERRLREAGIEVGRFDPDLMAQVEEQNRDFIRQHEMGEDQPRDDTSARPFSPGSTGPNGHPVGYSPEGDLVEWIPDDEEPGKVWPLVLRRNDVDIHEMYEELYEKVWWNRHKSWVARIESGEVTLSDEQKPLLEEAKIKAAQIEDEYGLEELSFDDFEWGLVNGRFSALAWVTGSAWDESLDT